MATMSANVVKICIFFTYESISQPAVRQFSSASTHFALDTRHDEELMLSILLA